MKPYHKNPRQITKKQLSDLRQWLQELGDLSGVVHDLNSDEIVAGNQRGKIFGLFDLSECEVVISEQFEEPDAQGTVGLGYVIWQGQSYSYRQVRWTARQCEQANIVANRAGGEWDVDILADEWAMGDLLAWGFEKQDFNFEPFGKTSTDRDGQGVSSTWGQVRSAPGKIVIDDIETRLPEHVVERLKKVLIVEYEQNDRPIHQTLETVILTGVSAFEVGDSGF